MDTNSTQKHLIGAPFEGGFYAGRFRIGNDEFALIVAPKAEGVTSGPWGDDRKDVPGARSCFDGRANTIAMAEAGSDLARWALNLEINGYADWHLPSRDELEILYRNLKPTTRENHCNFRDGDNASSVPAGYPYSENSPAQTVAEAFISGGVEAFDPMWHWSSTQFSPRSAWVQCFSGGSQDDYNNCITFRTRAVRITPVI